MSTRRIVPSSDAGPNQGAATPAVAHYLNVDENPNDGASTFIQFTTQGQQETYGLDVSAIPDNEPVLSVTLRASVAGAGDISGFVIGLRIAGVDYNSVEQFPSIGSGYQEYVPVSWTENPATMLPWSKADLATTQIIYTQSTFVSAIPRPRLSAFDGYATTGDPVVRPSMEGADRVPEASAASVDGSTASGAVRVPEASAAALAASSSAAVPAGPEAAAAPTVPLSGAAALGRSGHGVARAKPTADGDSLAPTASPSVLGPTATGQVIAPPRGDAG